MSDEHDALAERLAGSQTLMEQALKHIQSQLDDLSEFIVGRDKFDNLSVRVEAVEKHTHETDVWRNSIDRAVWLLSVIGGVCVAVLTALLIAWVTGQMQVVWK